MSHTQTLQFISGFVDDGDTLDFVSTADIHIPANSEVALQTLRCKPRPANQVNGTLFLTHYRDGQSDRLMRYQFPKFTLDSGNQQQLDQIVAQLNDELPIQMSSSMLKEFIDVDRYIGTTLTGFSGTNLTLELATKQFYVRGVADAIVQGTASGTTEIETQAIQMFVDGQGNTTQGAAFQLELDASGDAVDDGYASGQNRITQFGFARMGVAPLNPLTNTKDGNVGLAFFSAAQTQFPPNDAERIVTVRHYSKARGVAGIARDEPYVAIFVGTQRALTLPTTQNVYYEIRKFNNQIVVYRNIEANSAPPKGVNNTVVDPWESGVIFQITYSGDVYPGWDMIRGSVTGGFPEDSRKQLFDCFYVSEFLINPVQLIANINRNWTEAPIAQNRNIDPNATVELFFDNADENPLFGLPTNGLIVPASGLSKAGFEFTMTAPSQYASSIGSRAFSNLMVTLLEPVQLQNFTIFGTATPSKRSNALAYVNGRQNITTESDVVYNAETPIFYKIEAPGPTTSRRFSFQIKQFNGDRVLLQGNVFINLLIRSY